MTGETWDRLHGEHLELLVRSVRLRIERRARWLRTARWSTDPLEELTADLVTDQRADRLLAADDREAAAVFADDDEVSAVLIAAIERTAAELGALGERLIEAGAPARIDRLTEAAGLTAIERDGLITALAVALDPAIGALLGYVQDDPALAYATPGVVAALFDTPGHLAWGVTAPSRPLRAYGLVEADHGRPWRIVLTPRTLAWLTGDDRTDPALRAVLRRSPPPLLAPSHGDVTARVVEALDGAIGTLGTLGSVGNARALGSVQLVGPAGGSIAAAAAAALGRQLLTVDAAALVAHAERDLLLDALERESLLAPAVLHVDAGEVPPEAEQELARLIDRTSVPAVVTSPSRLPTRGAALVERLPIVTASDREALWREAAGTAEPGGDELRRLADTFRLEPHQIAAASAEAVRMPAATGDPGVGLLWAAARASVGRALGGLATRIRPSRAPDDLVLPPDELAALDELVAQTRHGRRVYDEWELRRLVPHGQGVTALFAGPSGTGKTMAAEILAGRLGLDLYRVDLSAVVSKYIGETEKNLRRLFDAAESGAAVLLFDEADALFGKRTEVKDAHDRYANVEVNYLLQRMEQYAGIAVLTTNRKGDLDEAFLRRLRMVLTFPFPDPVRRRCIWERMLANDAPQDALDLDALARLELTGGSIRNIVLAAAFQAAEAGDPLSMTHLMGAARREYGKLDKGVTPSEFGAWSAVAS